MNPIVQQIHAEFDRLRPNLTAPKIHQVARDFYPSVKKLSIPDRDSLCTELFASRNHAEGALVCYLYRRFAKQCGAREFALFTSWLDKYVDNWGMTDGVSLWLLGASIANDATLIDKLDPWTRSKNRWKRRAAAVAMVYSAKRGEHTRAILSIAAPLVEDPDDMVQKGVGWLLKETYPKKPSEVVRFLVANRAKPTRLLLRYAAEKMTASDRTRVLAR